MAELNQQDEQEQANNNSNDNNDNHDGEHSPIKEQDRYLPVANITRIMKKSLPKNAKISKEAKECIQECVSEFISFITSEASDRCQQEKRKTINGDDLLWAMTTLGFDNYLEPLKLYLHKYRETQVSKRVPSKKEYETQINVSTLNQQNSQMGPNGVSLNQGVGPGHNQLHTSFMGMPPQTMYASINLGNVNGAQVPSSNVTMGNMGVNNGMPGISMGSVGPLSPIGIVGMTPGQHPHTYMNMPNIYIGAQSHIQNTPQNPSIQFQLLNPSNIEEEQTVSSPADTEPEGITD